MRVSGIHLTVTLLIHLVHGWILRRSLTTGRSVPDGWEVRTATRAVGLAGGGGGGVGGGAIALASATGGPLAFLIHLALVVFFLFAGLPLFADLFEFYSGFPQAN